MWTLLLSLAFGLSHSPVCTFGISLEMGMLLFSDVAHNYLRSWYSILFILTLLQRYEHYPTECLDYSRVTLPSFEHDSSKGLHSLDSHLIFVTGQCLEFWPRRPDHRRRLLRHRHAPPRPPAQPPGQDIRSRHRPRRHLVLEPLLWRARVDSEWLMNQLSIPEIYEKPPVPIF